MSEHGLCPHNLCGARRFPPQDQERDELLEKLHRSPQDFGQDRSRWSLDVIRQQFLPTLRTVGGVWRRLQKWQIALKHGRFHITSPDPEYAQKVEAIATAYQQMQEDPDHKRLLYADELTFYRQPVLSPCYHEQGKTQPHAHWPGGYNTKYRIASSMDAQTGEVVSYLASTVGIKQLCQWLADVRKHYGADMALTIAWDNWPIHKHPRVEAAAAEQRITLLYVPTYAPWTNPIEKLWRWLKQQVLRMHRYEDKERWPKLREWVREFLDQFATPSERLLKYVGLRP